MPLRQLGSLDASTITLDIDAAVDLGRPFASFIGVQIDGPVNRSARGFGGGLLDYGATVAREAGIELTEEYSYQQGRLRIGVDERVDPVSSMREVRRLGIWEGQRYSLKTMVYGETSEVIAFLDYFTLTESEHGLTIAPKDPNIARIEREGRNIPLMVLNIPQMGLLEMRPLTSDLARRLPRHQGRGVRGGELFIQGRGTELTFLLVGETTVSRLYPNWWEISSENEALDKMASTIAGWRET